ncbi:efflux RND transporter periplasmic adaptor subunit [Prosthecobacter sp.]|uniref:efflux RND transporter periplasmic adaptor subunit n=1 Tax=Prosthecobacter sp. TaxID=1965333 RepID=UPI003784FA69
MSLAVLMALSQVSCHKKEAVESHETTSSLFQKTGNRITIPENSPLRKRLEFEPASKAERTVSRQFTGTIEADPVRLAHVFPTVAGRLVKILVTLGDNVTEGQPVAIISAPDCVTAQADYAKAKSSLNLADRSLKRQLQLLSAKVAAQKDLDEAQDAFDAAKANLDASTQVLKLMGYDPEKDTPGGKLRVLAPQSGKIISVNAGMGEVRNDNNAPLATVADLSTVWLTIHVPERDLVLFHQDAPVEASFESYPGQTFKGVVAHLGDVISEDTRVAPMRVELPNPDGRLKPGMFATVTVLAVTERNLTLPSSAILQVGPDAFVFEQVEPFVLESRSVIKGGDAGPDRVIILSGIREGALILKQNAVLFQ